MWDGFVLINATGNTLDGNTAKHNSGGPGFTLSGASGNTLTRNTADDDQSGFLIVDGSSHNTLSHNTAVKNGDKGVWGAHYGWGFLIQGGADENTLDHNVANDNGDFGFVVTLASGNVLTHDVANNNRSGFGVDRGTGNSFTKDVANGNGEDGFVLFAGSAGNTVQSCEAHHNKAHDAYDQNAKGANTWKKNAFGKTDPPGL